MRARAVLSALPAVIKRQADEDLYRIYSAEALRIASDNTSRIGGGNTMQNRYVDLVNPPKEETRTAEEIINHVKNHGWGGEA